MKASVRAPKETHASGLVQGMRNEKGAPCVNEAIISDLAVPVKQPWADDERASLLVNFLSRIWSRHNAWFLSSADTSLPFLFWLIFFYQNFLWLQGCHHPGLPLPMRLQVRTLRKSSSHPLPN